MRSPWEQVKEKATEYYAGAHFPTLTAWREKEELLRMSKISANLWEENQERCPYGTSSGRKNQEYQILLIGQVRLHVCVHVCVYIHTKHTLMCTFTTIIKEKETRNLKRAGDCIRESSEGGKGRRKISLHDNLKQQQQQNTSKRKIQIDHWLLVWHHCVINDPEKASLN